MKKTNLLLAMAFAFTALTSCTTKNNSMSDAPGLKTNGTEMKAAGGPQATGSATPSPTLSEQATSAPANGAPTVAPSPSAD